MPTLEELETMRDAALAKIASMEREVIDGEKKVAWELGIGDAVLAMLDRERSAATIAASTTTVFPVRHACVFADRGI